MKVEGYNLDLYCDNRTVYPDLLHDAHHINFPQDFAGRSRRDCMKQARRHGWILGKVDLCPICAKKKQGGAS